MSASPPAPGRWVVCKYGGTSVASLATWTTGILARTRALRAQGHRVWIVVSALTKVTNALLAALDEATGAASAAAGAEAGSAIATLPPSSASASSSSSSSAAAGGASSAASAGAASSASASASSAFADELPSFAFVRATHERLAADMGFAPGSADYAPAQALLDELRRLLDGIRLTGEVSPKLRARVAAFGELLSSQLGAAFLRRSGLAATRVDSRSLLTSHEDDEARGGADAFLEADVRPSVQVERADAAALGAPVVICQGFVAATPGGATCLLGRGGSDTSGALFAALCGALQIWQCRQSPR